MKEFLLLWLDFCAPSLSSPNLTTPETDDMDQLPLSDDSVSPWRIFQILASNYTGKTFFVSSSVPSLCVVTGSH
jgi:hypothetical protein